MPSKRSANITTIWVGTRAVDMVPFDHIVPIDGIVTCDYGSDVQELENTKIVFSLEKQQGVKHVWSNLHVAHLIQDDIQRSLLRYLTHLSGPVQFFCYSSSGLLDQLIVLHNLPARNLSVSIWQKLFFDDKIHLHYTLKWMGIETLPTETYQLGNLLYETLEKRVGGPLVIKLPFGSAGSSVFFADNQERLNEIQQQFCSATVLVQQFRPGISLNVHAVIFADNILLAPPSMQIIGSEVCSLKKFEWCGNDFHVKGSVPDDLITRALALTRKIGRLMKAQGYRGTFGLDLLLDIAHDQVYLLEINPRQQGSTSLLTQLELLNQASSFLIEYHLVAFDGHIPEKDLVDLLPSFPIAASQVILHHKSGKREVVERTISSGIYTLEEQTNTLKWVRSGLSLLDCKDPSEFVIAGGTPLEKQIIMPHAPMLWVQSFSKALSDPISGKLTREMGNICTSIYRELLFSELV
jgi:ATP-grasp domain